MSLKPYFVVIKLMNESLNYANLIPPLSYRYFMEK